MDFEVDLTGFEQAEIDRVLYDVAQSSTKAAAAEDACPPTPPAAEVVTREGHLWTLGRHTLLCGDAEPALHGKALSEPGV